MVLVVVYSAVCLLGLPANCLTAWLTLLQVLQRNVLAVYLFCLSLCFCSQAAACLLQPPRDVGSINGTYCKRKGLVILTLKMQKQTDRQTPAQPL